MKRKAGTPLRRATAATMACGFLAAGVAGSASQVVTEDGLTLQEIVEGLLGKLPVEEGIVGDYVPGTEPWTGKPENYAVDGFRTADGYIIDEIEFRQAVSGARGGAPFVLLKISATPCFDMARVPAAFRAVRRSQPSTTVGHSIRNGRFTAEIFARDLAERPIPGGMLKFLEREPGEGCLGSIVADAFDAAK